MVVSLSSVNRALKSYKLRHMLNRFIHTILSITLSRKRIYLLSLLTLLAIGCGADDGPEPDADGDGSNDVTDPPDDTEPDTPLEVSFIKTYGGSQDDSFQDVIATTDGGFAALGYSQSVDGDITDNTSQVNMYWVV